MMGGSRFLCVLLPFFAVGAGVTATMQWGGDAQSSNAEHRANKPVGLPEPAAPIAGKFSVSIRKPPGPPRVVTALKDVHGSSVTVACSTCHTTRPPNHQNKTVQTLDEFHRGMAFSHGTVSCLSCHNPNDYDSLQLADGSRVDFTDVMTLCGQCHGPQMKDYGHGVHGGLNGYWDLTRGSQQKNNCVDCHNPHAPQFPKMQPTFKPKDRFLEKARSEN
ncbi:MAG: hypothetical protein KDB01_02325 [Planctomycetaceae bacterium]|nr:hypothetical protein [Planctomycetaceae bacterium]